jgi:excisionase family DNA binding protein
MKKRYTTKEVAALFNVSEETVRRWIRNGDLKAYKQSNKSGHLITEDDLRNFVTKRPKYRKFIDDRVNKSIETEVMKLAILEYVRAHREEIRENLKLITEKLAKRTQEAMET